MLFLFRLLNLRTALPSTFLLWDAIIFTSIDLPPCCKITQSSHKSQLKLLHWQVQTHTCRLWSLIFLKLSMMKWNHQHDKVVDLSAVGLDTDFHIHDSHHAVLSSEEIQNSAHSPPASRGILLKDNNDFVNCHYSLVAHCCPAFVERKTSRSHLLHTFLIELCTALQRCRGCCNDSSWSTSGRSFSDFPAKKCNGVNG